MHITQKTWSNSLGWSNSEGGSAVNWVLVFGAPALLRDANLFERLRGWYPEALITGCSTAGEIDNHSVRDNSLVVTAVEFERTRVEAVRVAVDGPADSQAAAERIAAALVKPGLRHVLVLCDGLGVNGSALARTLRQSLPPEVLATGGLAGDGAHFNQTLACFNGPGESGTALAIGFYGAHLQVGCGSLGGWDSFGPARRVTRSHDNVLFELDGQNALELYRSYLGEHAAGLPASALLFPLLIDDEHGGPGLVRTVLGIDEAAGSMTFAGDLPQGRQARLMRANFDRLVDGASGAALASREGLRGQGAELALLISCVGRKLVLRQRVEEEVEAVRDALGPGATLTGFYSYGEICPQGPSRGCELHNQTMTITTFAES